MKNDIYILLDYRSHLYTSVRYRGASTDIDELKKQLDALGFRPVVKKFSDIDLRTENYKDKFVLYQSAQDRDLRYKNYIEDKLLGLTLQGARLLPDFAKFRAHHNKVFMEILRDLSDLDEIKNIESKTYGSYEEFEKDIPSFPGNIVIKPSSGDTGSQVRLLKNDQEKRKYGARISDSFHLLDYCKKMVNILFNKKYVRKSTKRKKFIIQNFVPGLQGDYKVLVYFDKYYVLYRENRVNDFRASGSGRLHFREELPDGLLDFAERVFRSFDTLFVSLDIGCNGGQFYLMEFQFLHFGTYTIEKSRYYFRKSGHQWERVDEQPLLEREIAGSVSKYISRKWGDVESRPQAK